MATNTKIISEFIAQLDKSITLTEEEVGYWKSNAQRLPLSLIKYFSNYLKKENTAMGEDIARAIKNDPKIVDELKMKKKNIFNKISRYYSEKDVSEAEELLLEALKKTND